MVQWRLEFKPQDFWIGVFWKDTRVWKYTNRRDIWLCLVPMVPLHFVWLRPRAGHSVICNKTLDNPSLVL